MLWNRVRKSAFVRPEWAASLIAVAIAPFGFAGAAESPPAAWRRPAAAVLLSNGQELAVANEGTGTISVIGTAAGSLLSEAAIGQRLTSLAGIPDSPWLLATDPESHELIAIRNGRERIATLAVATSPMNVVVAPDRRTAVVASQWSRRLTLVALDATADAIRMSKVDEIALPFAPRLQAFLPAGRHVVVADAFGGKLAVVNLETREVESVRELPGSNIRGLVVTRDGKSLAIAHQNTNRLANTTGDDIHWGMLAQNVIRLVDIEAVLKSDAPLYRHGRTLHLGQPGFGAADPAGLAELPNGEWLVAISGVDEVAVTRDDGAMRARIKVGDRPAVIVLDAGNERAWSLDQLSDTVSVINVADGTLAATVSLGPQPAETPASRGERLFFDAALSHDRWLSCHSCHSDGHTTGHLVDTKSDGTFGTPKRILTLLGTRDANPWAWNGAFRELHEQVRQSVTSSMQGRSPTPAEVNDMVAYLHTLEPAPPIAPAVTDGQQAAVAAGERVFERAGCVRCHIPTLTYTSDAVYDVGFEDEAGLKKFNPPSLRGVSQRQSLLHDGRAASLKELFTEHSHQLAEPLSETDLNALLEFLRSL